MVCRLEDTKLRTRKHVITVPRQILDPCAVFIESIDRLTPREATIKIILKIYIIIKYFIITVLGTRVNYKIHNPVSKNEKGMKAFKHIENCPFLMWD